jgi:hypothetical protein
MKKILLLSFVFSLVLTWTSCTKTVIITGSSQTGVFYNRLAMGIPGSGGGFSPKRKYRQGVQIVPLPIYHTIGGSMLVGVKGDFSDAYVGGALHYDPRLTIARWSREGTMSINFPMAVGLTRNNNFVDYQSNVPENLKADPTVNLTAEVPMNFTFNFGYAATPKSFQSFGGFFGFGYAFAYIPNGRTGTYAAPPVGEIYKMDYPIAHGPHVRGGIRFRTGQVSWQMYGSFLYSIYPYFNQWNSHLGSIGVGFTFGK